MRGRGATVVVGIAMALAAITVGGYLWHRSSLGLSAEEYRWETVFRNLSTHGVAGIFRRGAGSYRPVCGCLLAGQARLELSTGTRHAAGAVLFVLNAALLGVLVLRLGGRRGAIVSVVIALAWSTNDEVLLWLGGRCDLLLAFFGLAGALCVLAAARADRPGAAVPWAIGASVAVALASLSKETGLLLPVMWLPLVPRGRWLRVLAPAAAMALAVLLVRSYLMSGLGPYVGHYARQGLGHWARSGARAVGLLLIGPAAGFTRAPLVAACVAVACAVVVLGVRFRRERWIVPVGMCLAAALAPCALLATDRALYPVVLVMAALVGLAVQQWPSRVLGGTLIVLLAGHCAGSLIMQRRWADAFRARAAGVVDLSRHVATGAILVLVAPRQYFNGLHLEAPLRQELPGFARVVWACHLGRRNDGRGLGVATKPVAHGPETFSFALPRGVECAQQSSSCAHAPVCVRPGDGVVDVEIVPSSPVLLVYWDAAGQSHSISAGSLTTGPAP